MPSVVAHAAAALSMGALFRSSALPARFWVVAGLAVALPDLDAALRPFGNLEAEQLFGGHRGLTHSIPFAMALSAMIVQLRVMGPGWIGSKLSFWIWLTLAIASHGVLDTFTQYGEGVALLAPISWHQFKSSWTPLGTGGACRGMLDCAMRGVSNEALWIGVPSLMLFGLSRALRKDSEHQ
jgi:inner membrane protein